MSSPAVPTTALPTGTVTFLFTDVEGSTRLWELHPTQMRAALIRHDALIESLTAQHHGQVVRPRGEGDSRFCVFPRASDAVAAAGAIQYALHQEPWPPETPVKIRVAVHTGEADLRDGDYYGSAVNRAARLRSAAHGGQTLVSDATAALVRDSLPVGTSLKDLGEHRLKDLARPERIAQLTHAALPQDFPPLRTLDTLPNNLPRQLTSFVGREKELAQVARLLGTTQLLTLTGAGGSGKTRLALQAAADALEDFPDGVFLVELAPIGDPTQVPAAVAGALGVREEEGRPLVGTVADWLRSKHLLLVLDNCEHLVAACASLAESLLRVCPKLQLVATSREPLGVPGETSWRVPSLSLPQPDRVETAEALSQYEAVRLFVDRACSVRPDFQVTNQNAPAVAAICHRLDGIPLALELAAARVRALPPDQLLARLEDRFRLLTGGSRTALPRQQTLQALVDWSYSLLAEPERLLFTRLSVFYGGFTLEAAEHVCAGGPVEQWEVVDLLTKLVDKSLVLAEDQSDGSARYRLLETLRQYARQKLLDLGADEAEAIHTRHAEHFAALGERALREVEESDLAVWSPLRRLEPEEANLRAALRWRLDRREAHEALQLVEPLWRVLLGLGRGGEAEAPLREALALPGAEARTDARARALFVWSMRLRAADGRLDEADAGFAEALAIWRETGNDWHAAWALINLGTNAGERGDVAGAVAYQEEARAVFRACGSSTGVAAATNNIAVQAMREGDHERARTLYDEALATLPRSGFPEGRALLINNLGLIAHQQGRLDDARAHFEEALAIHREHSPRRVWTGLILLARLALDARDAPTAVALAQEAVAVARAGGDAADTYVRAGTAQALGVLAEAELELGARVAAREHAHEALLLCWRLAEEGRTGPLRSVDRPAHVHALHALAALTAPDDPRCALRLAGAAASFRRSSVNRIPVSQARRERHLEAARAALTWEEAAAWAEGEAMSPEEAINDALNSLPTLEPAPL